MIRIVEEHYAETDPIQSASRSYFQPINKSNQGLKHLKQTQDSINHVKRRLSLLEVQQQKNRQKMKENYRKLKFLAKVQDSHLKEQMRKMKHAQKAKEKLQLTKIINDMEKKKQQQSISEKRNVVYSMNKSSHNLIKNQTTKNEKNISMRKMNEKERKIERRIEINKMENKQRENISRYFKRKRESFQKNSEAEGRYFEARKQERDLLLDELTLVQMEMIERQSMSKAALDESSERLSRKKGTLYEKSRKPEKRSLSVNEHETKKKLQFLVI